MRIRKRWVTFIVVLAVAIIAYFILNAKTNQTTVSAEVAQCIGNNSIMYSQAGCIHCKEQEDLFGDNVKYLNITDCLKEENTQKCIDAEIKFTPTWVIKNQSYTGLQTIERLKELTECY